MELDVGKLVVAEVVPKLEARIDRIVAEVVGKFKSGKLTQAWLDEAYADMMATRKLLSELNQLYGGV